MMNKGVLVVISGFSGSGKGTLMKELLDRYPNYALSISCTTRKPRPGEVDGRDYYFVTEDRFKEMIEKDELVEHACYCGKYYGTPRFYVEQQRAEGKDVLLEIEIQGALQIKEKYPDSVLVFVMPPSAQELKSRLVGRGTETPEVVAARLSRAAEESDGMEQYDYLLVNDNLEECSARLHQIILAQHYRPELHLDEIAEMKEQLKQFLN
jgi:guanylate kinase